MKYLLAGAMAVILSLGLYGCGGQEQQSNGNLVDSYKQTAQQYIDAGDVVYAQAVLEEGIAQTGDHGLQQMLDQLTAPETTNHVTAETTIPVITESVVPVNTEPTPGNIPNYNPSSPLEYWIEYCDVRYLSSYDLIGLTKEECRIAHNAIFAKSGRIFKDKDLSDYFSSYNWYHPYIHPENFSNTILSDVQLHNLNVVIEYEKEW